MKELVFSSSWYYFVIMAIVCYFCGCFNFAILISKIKHKDIRGVGSGNPGTMNMFREFGLGIGLITFLSDVLKGGIPAVISYFIFKNYVFAGTNVLVSDFTRYFCGMFVIIGHIFPVTLKFKGGKGIASTFGLFCIRIACEKWWFFFIGVLLIVAIAAYILKIHWGSMGSLMGVTTFSCWQGVIFYLHYSDCLNNVWVILMFLILLVLNLLTWIAHHGNIVRLMTGEERLTGTKKKKKAV